MIRYTAAATAAFALAACSPTQPDAPEASGPASSAAETPATLSDLATYRDWANGDAATHAAAFDAGVGRILSSMSRTQTVEAFGTAGYECQYGEASDQYPDPMQVCTREFATRECQMTWDVTTTADGGMTAEILTGFRRDCVGTDRDWPQAVRSAIDDQLAPPALPAPTPN